MKVIEIEEQEDGSAIVTVDLTFEEVKLIVNAAITKALTEFLETVVEQHDDNKGQTNLGNTEY
jgi:hypothetical protein